MQDEYVHKQFLGPDHVARQASEAKKKLQSHYDGEKKGWDWIKYFALHKEQHTTMDSLADPCCSCRSNSTKVSHFLQEIKIIELEAEVISNQGHMARILMPWCLILTKWS